MSQKKNKIGVGSRCKKMTGYLLIDLLMGTLLFSFAGTGLVSGSVQLFNIREKVIRHFTSANMLRMLYLRIETDFGRVVLLPDVPLRAGSGWVEWPIDKSGSEPYASRKTPLSIVRYELKEGSILRTETPLPKDWNSDNESKQRLGRNVQGMNLWFAYRDTEKRVYFQPEWCEAEGCGLPSAVKIELEVQDGPDKAITFSRLITIPHGKPGVVQPPGEA